MAKINRFYLLISMLVSYRIGNAMASPAITPQISTILIEESRDWYNGEYISYLARRYADDASEGCYVCVPLTEIHPSSWESEAVEWYTQRQNNLNGDCITGNLDDSVYAHDTLVSVGIAARLHGDGYTTESDTEYLLCTTKGWKRVQYPNKTVSYSECQTIDRDRYCMDRGSDVSDHDLQSGMDYLLNKFGADMTTPKWQVCLFGENKDFCKDQQVSTGCSAGQYKTTSGTCAWCPNPSFSWAEYEEGEYVEGETVSSTSKAGSVGLESCYISSSGYNKYYETPGIFSLIEDCYYYGS